MPSSFAVTAPLPLPPISPAVLRYVPEVGYVPAGFFLPDFFACAIAEGKENARESGSGAMGEWDGNNKCAVLSLLLAGRIDEVRLAMGELYPFTDAEEFWQEIVQAISRDPDSTRCSRRIRRRLKRGSKPCLPVRAGVKKSCNFIDSGWR